MTRVFQSLVMLLATATKQELTRQVAYLKVENQILRSKLPGRVQVTDKEKRKLVRAGKGLGGKIKDLISIVSPKTFLRWVKGEEAGAKKPKKKPGRPRTDQEIRDLVVKLAKENDWGYTRILGELRKLGIKISRQTVKNILVEHGLNPDAPKGQGSWEEFLKIHAKTLWQCDFLSVRSFTKNGLVDLYLLIWIQIDSRRVFISPATQHPNGAWVNQQARNFCHHLEDEKLTVTHVRHDADTKFTCLFDEILKTEGIDSRQLPIRSPNLNAYVERFIQTLRKECLDKFLVVGERHLDHLVSQFMAHYHAERPHQAKMNRPLFANETSVVTEPTTDIICVERLGGVLKHYRRRAA